VEGHTPGETVDHGQAETITQVLPGTPLPGPLPLPHPAAATERSAAGRNREPGHHQRGV
jgi:hypothetical protein